MINTTNKLIFSDYLKVNYYLAYRKPAMIAELKSIVESHPNVKNKMK